MNWLRAHWNACRLALQRLAGAPLSALLSILGIGIALALPAGGQLLLGQIAALSQSASATPQLSLFLTLDADRKAALAINARLQDRRDVAKTQLLAREDTLVRMKAAEGLADVIAALPKNPFPDAIVITPADDSPAAIEKLATEARQWPHVEHVQIDADWARRLHALIRLGHMAVLLLATLLGLGLVATTFNTIRLQVLTRQAEIEVSQLLGATDAFVRRPFHWYGSLLGCLGGLAAWLIVSGATLWLRQPVAELGQLYGLDLLLTLPSPGDSALWLGAATLLGWLGAALSVRQHLRTR